jgi:hypothetical protein
MAVVVPNDFGFLELGETNNFRGALNINRRDEAVMFKTGAVRETVTVSSAPRGNPGIPGAHVDIALYQDADGNGILDTSKDTFRSLGNASGSFELFSMRLSQGTYFIHATSSVATFVPYDLKFSRQNSGAANPFTTPEIRLGRISDDLTKTGGISNVNAADNYAFKLDGKTDLDIKVLERGKKTGDVNIRVVQDLDRDGEVDPGEVVAKGISSLNGNIDKISGLEGKGDYILQVCQTNGNTPYTVKFDHTSI